MPEQSTELAGGPRGSRHRGTNQTGVRLYNERLALSLIRRHGSLAKVDIAKLTGLSAQTVSVIVKQLEADGLLRKEKKQRGKVGQPSVPFSLRDDGAFAIGLKIGRRSADLVLLGLTGTIHASRRQTYAFPRCESIVDFVRDNLDPLLEQLSPARRQRVAGLGVAMPYEIWNWRDELGAPAADLDRWRAFDIKAELEAVVPWTVHVCNDATAACAAELVFGEAGRFSDFVYFYVGAFIGGGIVLGGQLLVGRTGNAGALGSMLVTENGRPQQLLRRASIYLLEDKFMGAGLDASAIWQAPEDWPDMPGLVDPWIETASQALAEATVSACAVIDFEAAIIDGAFPQEVRGKLVAATKRRFERLDRQGLSAVEFAEGGMGPSARAVGGASLPLLANFTQDREVLFKEGA